MRIGLCLIGAFLAIELYVQGAPWFVLMVAAPLIGYAIYMLTNR